MLVTYFTVLCVIAAINMILQYRVNSKQNGHYSLLFFSVFISCLGHLMLALSSGRDEAVLANKMIYTGTIFLPFFTFDASLSVCKIRIPALAHDLFMLVVFVIFGMSLTVGFNDFYYKSIEYIQIEGAGNYTAVYGIGHAIFNCLMVGYVVCNVSLIVYAFLKKKNVSFNSLIALSLIEVVSILSFFTSRFFEYDTLIMPAVYVFAQFALLYICFRVKRYDVEQFISQDLESRNTDSFVLVTSKFNYLGCNEEACETFPTLANCRIDYKIRNNSRLNRLLIVWIREMSRGVVVPEKKFKKGDRYYKIKFTEHPLSKHEKVYMFKIEDETSIHNYINMLDESNVRLEQMLKENDSQIRSLQERMLIGMAHMVENRDSNTGSHIKRTSNVVSILVDYLRQKDNRSLSDFFYDSLITAAPMHDIGKIAVDDRILRKPGRFTPEEYEEMKSHPEKGAMIVENLLTSIETPEFVQIVCNVTRYHHERYDGGGYPSKLKGEDIPYEARIMAVADVYDALVSQRCYKEAMSFDKAYSIVIEGMGSQFDPSLRECFEACRSKLETYYRNLKE
ncbi:MAG: HD domain-containing protein [Fibrobacter sp.]|nr:HD domain-containing protein [Fibrobacter sp.]